MFVLTTKPSVGNKTLCSQPGKVLMVAMAGLEPATSAL